MRRRIINHIRNTGPVANPAFIMRVKTDNTGTSGTTQFTIPTTGAGYNYNITTTEHSLTGQTGSVTLTFSVAGTYDVSITENAGAGSFPRIFFNNGGDRRKVLEISNWGAISWTSFSNAFNNCSNMNLTATDKPNLLSVTNAFQNMFANCGALNPTGLAATAMEGWVFRTDAGFNCNGMLQASGLFNVDINGWNMTRCTDIGAMFANCTSFNQSLNSWSLANNTNLIQTFYGCTAFNGNISSWNTAAVDNMAECFYECTAFNQNIGSWNTSAVTNMSSTFYNCLAFNQTLSWNTSAVTNMNFMFRNVDAFRASLAAFDMNQVTVMTDFMRFATGMSIASTDATLAAFAGQIPWAFNGTLYLGGSQYTIATSQTYIDALLADGVTVSLGAGV